MSQPTDEQLMQLFNYYIQLYPKVQYNQPNTQIESMDDPRMEVLRCSIRNAIEYVSSHYKFEKDKEMRKIKRLISKELATVLDLPENSTWSLSEIAFKLDPYFRTNMKKGGIIITKKLKPLLPPNCELPDSITPDQFCDLIAHHFTIPE